MKFGVLNVFDAEGRGQQEVFAQAIKEYALADELGWDTAWVAEHHFTAEYGVLGNPSMMLAALARETTRIRLGSAIHILPFHDPVRVAEDVALVDHLSGGRVELGVGRGYQKPEFDGFDIPLAESKSRFTEALDIILEAWKGQPFSYTGQHYRVPEITTYPTVLQQPRPPIWVAGQSPETMKFIAEKGLNLITAPNAGFTEFAGWVRDYRTALADNGFDPATREIAMSRFVYVTEEPVDLDEAVAPYLTRYWQTVGSLVKSGIDADQAGDAYKHHLEGWKALQDSKFGALAHRYLVAGTPDQCVEQLRSLESALGVTQMLCHVNFGGLPGADAERTLRLMADEVLPKFR
jgi:alkanesulfonate monooxygenase SsuD/methylene tetrahydromethanopterin reductase-like flavin-dependent oxidoreductase (luciferase family)